MKATASNPSAPRKPSSMQQLHTVSTPATRLTVSVNYNSLQPSVINSVDAHYANKYVNLNTSASRRYVFTEMQPTPTDRFLVIFLSQVSGYDIMCIYNIMCIHWANNDSLVYITKHKGRPLILLLQLVLV